MPRSGESEAITPRNGSIMKNTPGKSAGICKTLLTPCRRLGLSRKFKSSPASNHNQESPNSAASTPESASKNREASMEGPPLKRGEKSAGKRSVGSSSRANIQARFQTQSSEEQLKPDNVEPPKCKKSADNENLLVISGNETKRNTKRTRHQNKSDVTSNLSNDTKSITPRTNSKPPEQPTTVLVSDSKQNIAKGSPENDLKRQEEQSAHITNNPAPKHIEETTQEEPKTKINTRKDGKSKTAVRRCLSMKKSLSYSQGELTDLTDFEDLPATPKTSLSSLLSQEFTECTVQLETVMQVEGVCGSDEETKCTVNQSIKKRRVVYSSDEEDFVPSQNSIKKDSETDKLVEVDWDSKIHEIKARIKSKEVRLEDLRRAGIYKKLHNVDNLEQLTQVWKMGCGNGLRHLLPKLQEHGPINMPNLLRKLNIPQKYLTYDADTDSFN